jgi:hypothetical protein
MRNFRLGEVLVALGALGVVAWLVTTLIAYDFPSNDQVFFEVGSTAVYVLAGFACWRWIAGGRKSGVDMAIVRGPSRVMAVASVVLAASFAADAHYRYQTHQRFHYFVHVDPHYRLVVAGFAAIVLGSLLAAVGLLIATADRKPVESETTGLSAPAVRHPSPEAKRPGRERASVNVHATDPGRGGIHTTGLDLRARRRL